MGDRARLSLQTLVQGFIFSLQVEGKVPSTVSCYQGNLRRFLWYAREHDWPDDPLSIDSWMLREFLAYASNARNRWVTEGNGSFGLQTVSMDAGRITKGLFEVGHHSFNNFRIYWRRGRTIKVYPFHIKPN